VSWFDASVLEDCSTVLVRLPRSYDHQVTQFTMAATNQIRQLVQFYFVLIGCSRREVDQFMMHSLPLSLDEMS